MNESYNRKWNGICADLWILCLVGQLPHFCFPKRSLILIYGLNPLVLTLDVSDVKLQMTHLQEERVWHDFMITRWSQHSLSSRINDLITSRLTTLFFMTIKVSSGLRLRSVSYTNLCPFKHRSGVALLLHISMLHRSAFWLHHCLRWQFIWRCYKSLIIHKAWRTAGVSVQQRAWSSHTPLRFILEVLAHARYFSPAV